MAKPRTPIEALLPLPLPVFHMLLTLCDGERHGYALKREILQRTGGKVNLGSCALYGSINRMLEQAAAYGVGCGEGKTLREAVSDGAAFGKPFIMSCLRPFRIAGSRAGDCLGPL